ncbi:MAG TPA: universal stress protein [Alphaproteobacteria bacterium]|jgi:nucleotide-binding universal stress UspA family protein
MSIKTILAPIADAQTGKNTLKAAFLVAKQFDAHVDVLHVRPDPRAAVVDYVGEAVSGAMIEKVIKSTIERSAKNAQSARKLFDAACRTGSVVIAERAPAPGGASAAWREEIGYEDRWLQSYGRLTDLVVVARALNDQDLMAKLSLEAGLMETGRPILVVPPKAPAKIGSSIAIAWKANAEASRAISAAMPFIETARKVTILSVAENDEDQRLTQIQAYLAWHGVRAKVESSRTKGDIGPALLSAADKAGADMLVMGAYSHSRVREMILGGVTKHVVANAGLPVLMAH